MENAFPEWTPPAVRGEIERRLARGVPEHLAAALIRIGTHPDVRPAWKELTDKDRKTGEYRYLPICPSSRGGTDETHELFLCMTVGAIHVALQGPIEANKGTEAAATSEEMLGEAAIVRKIANDLLKTNFPDPMAIARAEAMHWCADWWEKGARALRGPGDPLVIGQDRGNNQQRGVQIALAAFFESQLGRPLHGIAATFAAVALGAPKLSEWASRSAFSKTKSP